MVVDEAVWAVVLAAALLALPLTWLMRRVAVRIGAVQRPRSGRVHKEPTPFLGGVAIGISALVCAAAALGLSHGLDLRLIVLGVVLVAMVVLGLIDDLREVGPGLRLACEAVGAALLIAVLVDVPHWTGAPLVDAAVAGILIVVLTNSYNLLDNSDAALASVASVTGLGLGILALGLGQGFVRQEVWALAVAGACLGFLVFNWPPARIFSGDAGSLLIGFALVGSLVILAQGRSVLLTWVLCLGVLMTPLIDTTLVSVTRIREGRNVLSGGKDHLHHRLSRTALGQTGSVYLVAAVSLVGLGLSLAAVLGSLPITVVLGVLVVVWAAMLAIGLSMPSGYASLTEQEEAP